MAVFVVTFAKMAGRGKHENLQEKGTTHPLPTRPGGGGLMEIISPLQIRPIFSAFYLSPVIHTCVGESGGMGLLTKGGMTKKILLGNYIV